PALDGVGRGVRVHHLGWERDGSASIRQRSICHKRIVHEVHDTSDERWRRWHLGRNLGGECHESRHHPFVVPPLAETRTGMVVLPAAATKTFATIDSTSDLVHLYIESPINAIGMRASRTVGAGAAKNSWGVCRDGGGGSNEVAEAAGSTGGEHG
ncbi:hypothetical protein ACHAXN_008718, partial [Cyclotella atomus]